jgi:hypothetical protein
MATKPTYQTPTVMRLGAVQRGAGVCTNGSGDIDWCDVGNSASGWGCTAGTAATGVFCLDGNAASASCFVGSAFAGP